MATYQRHFSCEEANRLVPSLRRWFGELHALDVELMAERAQVDDILSARRNDVGGAKLHAYFALWVRWRRCLERILASGVQVKDLARGLVDFPHLCEQTGEEVFLCWELSETAVSHWHPLDAGYAGRRPLERLQQPDERSE